MKNLKSALTTFLILSLVLTIKAQQNESPKFTNPYLGQKPPGVTPELFAPGIVSTKHRVYANVTFSPDLNEVCWTPNSGDTTFWQGGILYSKKENSVWSEPKEIRFLENGYAHRSPYFGLNGKRLYFQGYQIINRGWDQQEKFYYVEKTEQGWTKPVLLDSIFNKYSIHWQFSLDSENNIWFGGDLRGVDNTGGIYFSRLIDGKYKEPELFFSNSEYGEAVFGPAISPDNSYLLFARVHPRGSTNPRIFSIYISFLKGDNHWTEPKELGEKLNMDGNQPRISPDGKYIFFIGNDSQAYWVDAKIIDSFK
jgi:hypothetical protein